MATPVNLNRVITTALREEGLEANLYGPRPHGFGIQVVHKGTNHLFHILETGQLVASPKGSNVIHNYFDLADPNCFQQIKDWLNEGSPKKTPNKP
jgi:hypothetical protein